MYSTYVYGLLFLCCLKKKVQEKLEKQERVLKQGRMGKTKGGLSPHDRGTCKWKERNPRLCPKLDLASLVEKGSLI